MDTGQALIAVRRFGAVLVAVVALATAVSVVPVAAAPETTVDELEALVAAIENESERTRLVGQLRALIAARKATAEVEAPGGLGSMAVTQISRHLKDASDQLIVVVNAIGDLPVLFDWLKAQAGDSATRERWMWFALQLLVIVAAGALAERLARMALARPTRNLKGRDSGSWVSRLMILTARVVLEAVPVAAFAGVAYVVAPVVRPDPSLGVVAVSVVSAYAILRGVLIVARLALVPAGTSQGLFRLDEESAAYLYIWCRRLVSVSVVGFFLAEAARQLGMPAGGHAGIVRLIGLLMATMVAVVILQNRQAMSAWLRGRGNQTLARFGMQTVRDRLADVWHVLAIAYVAGAYGVWAFGVEGGFEFLARATVGSIVIVVLARLAAALAQRAVERGFAVGAELKTRFPTLEARVNRYVPVVHLALRVAIVAVAAVALLQAWGIDALGWLESPLGARIVGSIVSIATVLVVSLLILEGVGTAIERYLATPGPDGRMIERGARVRTLLPLLRNVILIVVAVMVTLIVLSELGVNIAPLLAGAGVVGLAVGFGSQKLVQDVITGAFILFEDSIAVGDVVTVAGQSGMVEAISIRSIRLRDFSGSVHTIPFSGVDKITNMTKDFSFAVFDIGVAYREDTDHVTKVIKEVGSDLQADPEFAPLILEPIEVVGVDRFEDSAVVIKARMKTRPIRQWAVGREFNRRLKQRFDAEGIEIPFPHTTLYFGVDKKGEAPSARVQIDRPPVRDGKTSPDSPQGQPE